MTLRTTGPRENTLLGPWAPWFLGCSRPKGCTCSKYPGGGAAVDLGERERSPAGSHDAFASFTPSGG